MESSAAENPHKSSGYSSALSIPRALPAVLVNSSHTRQKTCEVKRASSSFPSLSSISASASSFCSISLLCRYSRMLTQSFAVSSRFASQKAISSNARARNGSISPSSSGRTHIFPLMPRLSRYSTSASVSALLRAILVFKNPNISLIFHRELHKSLTAYSTKAQSRCLTSFLFVSAA